MDHLCIQLLGDQYFFIYDTMKEKEDCEEPLKKVPEK